MVFKHTHEVIINEDIFNAVQHKHNGRRRPTQLREMPILYSMVYCTDCGSKLYQVRREGWTHDKEYMVCASYRKKDKKTCTSHYIKNVDIEATPLYAIKQVTSFAKEHDFEFIELVTKTNTKTAEREFLDSKKEYE